MTRSKHIMTKKMQNKQEALFCANRSKLNPMQKQILEKKKKASRKSKLKLKSHRQLAKKWTEDCKAKEQAIKIK